MAEYVYVIDIYVGGQYRDTVKIPASQVESGEYDKDVEFVLRELGEDAKVVATNLLRRLKEENKEITHAFKPGEVLPKEAVTVRYRRARKGRTYVEREPVQAPGIPPFELEGPSCILVDDSLEEHMDSPELGFKFEEGLGIIQCRAQAKGVELEIKPFNGLEPVPGIRYQLHFSKTYSGSKGERKFSRILILCHGMRQVFKEGDRWKDSRAPTLVTGRSNATEDYVTLKANEVLSVVGPYMERGGALYIAACRQWQCNWEYEAFKNGYEGEVYPIPGGGEYATLVKDLSWWEQLANLIFGPRSIEDQPTVTIFD
jgi:hypothetical protein